MAIQNRLLTYIAEVDIESKQYAGDSDDQPTPSELNQGVGFSDGEEDYLQNSMDQLQKGLIENLHEHESGSEELEAYEATERAHETHFSARKYASYESFRITRDKYLKNLRRQKAAQQSSTKWC